MKYQSIFSYYLRKICLDMVGVVGSSPIAPTKRADETRVCNRKCPLKSGHFCFVGTKPLVENGIQTDVLSQLSVDFCLCPDRASRPPSRAD